MATGKVTNDLLELTNKLMNPTQLTAISNQSSLTINAQSCYRIGRLIVGSIRFTTTSTISSNQVLIRGLPRIETTLGNGSGVGGVANNTTVPMSLLNSAGGGSISNNASASAQIYTVSFAYIAES